MRATWERGRWWWEKWEIEPVRISLTTLFRPFLSCLDSTVKTVNTSVSYNHYQVSRVSISHDTNSLCECVDIYVFEFVILWEHPVFSALVSSFTCQSDDQKYISCLQATNSSTASANLALAHSSAPGFIYALEDSAFSLNKCDFSRLFHTERSWHTYRFTVAFVSGRQDLPSDERAFSLTSFERKAFYCGWIRVLIFSKVPSGSD